MGSHQKRNALVLFYICPKRVVLKTKNQSWTILLSSLLVIFSSPKNNSLKFYHHNISLSWALAFFLLEHFFFAPPIAKPIWTMLVDNVGLKIRLLGTSNSMVCHYDIFFPWCKPMWSEDECQQPITYFIGPWDDFMVHGVNNPLYTGC